MSELVLPSRRSMVGSYWPRLPGLTLAYALVAALGLQWATVQGAGSPVWPAAGLGFAALLLSGVRLWPAVFLGRLLAGLVTPGPDTPLWPDLAIAAVNALAATLPVLLVERTGGLDLRLASLRSAGRLLLRGATVAALVKATMMTGVLAAVSGMSADRMASLWLTVGTAEFVGIATLGTLILAWTQAAGDLDRHMFVHLLAVCAATALMANIVFMQTGSEALHTWHLFPVLVWAALAFQVRGTALALTITSAFAVWGTTHGLGPFVDIADSPQARVALLQQFLAVTSLTMLLLAATADERRGQEALRESEARQRRSEEDLRLLLNSTGEGFYAVDREGVITMCNASFLQMFGFEREEDAVGRKLHDLLHHRRPDGSPYPVEEYPIYLSATRGTPAYVDGEVFRRLDGTSFPVESRLNPIWRDGVLQGAVCTFNDVSERKEAETALRGALATQEALLYEVNHRVKNSLQVVTSLLSLQAVQAQDPQVRRSLMDARSRIGVVASIHQSLYTSGTHTEVELIAYLRLLATDTVEALGGSRRVALEMDCTGEVVLSIRDAVPLALIISELLTNAMKYAFGPNDGGTLRVATTVSDGVLRVEVSDDGPGLPDGFDPARSKGVGMRVIAALCKQLRASLELVPRERGTSFAIVMPLR